MLYARHPLLLVSHAWSTVEVVSILTGSTQADASLRHFSSFLDALPSKLTLGPLVITLTCHFSSRPKLLLPSAQRKLPFQLCIICNNAFISTHCISTQTYFHPDLAFHNGSTEYWQSGVPGPEYTSILPCLQHALCFGFHGWWAWPA